MARGRKTSSAMISGPGRCILVLMVMSVCAAGAQAQPGPRVEFNRDIRPILSDKCFRCHGPDRAARQGDLRLDDRDEAIARTAIVPGLPIESTLVQRVTASAEDERMPPKDSGKSLSEREIQLLQTWIEQGAEYQPHWAFLPPASPPLPGVRQADWVRNPIDAFILAELERRQLTPARPADRATLLRRASLALNGISPTPDELDAFLAAANANSYEGAVTRLLASPRYAERMAQDWLDAARYADTHGYYRDFPRAAWPWRDWVLRAFASNMPFDQFTIEQLAGDLLPGASVDSLLATGFNRNHMVTDESGVIDEEYRVSYVADRLETTAAVWLGLTVGCARCHDHKYDPISQREYYELFAFFNNVPETGLIKAVESPPPVISLPSSEQQQTLASLLERRKTCEQSVKNLEHGFSQGLEDWLASADHPQAPADGLLLHLAFEESIADSGPEQHAVRSMGEISFAPGILGAAATFDATQYAEFTGVPLDTHLPFSLAVWIKPGSAPIGYVLSKIDDSPDQRGFEVLWYKSQPRINLVRTWRREAIELTATETFSSSLWHQLVVTYDGSSRAGGFQVYVDGVPQTMSVRRDSLSGSVENSAPWQIAWKGSGLGYTGQLDELRLYDRVLTPEEADRLYQCDLLSGAAGRSAAERTSQQQDAVRAAYLARAASNEARTAHAELACVKQEEAEVRRGILSAAVMQELPQPRETFVLVRGQYDQPGERIAFPGVPAALGHLPGSASPNRLALARWLVSPENPLTARVVVNRLWQQVFGAGLVRTANDFGFQGELPTHPELLDWLATEFIRSGWDIQHMLRLMVTSATFRQSSELTPQLLERDPENRLLARGPRFRLPAEQIRDQALALGGLLVEHLGGPSVKPYQPEGLWEAVSYNGDLTYEQDHGPSLYRRSIYTFWKRQAPPPDMLTFDGPTRETCVISRSRTNTPLQSLVLLNDVAYVEAARGLAERVLRHCGPDTTGQVRQGFRVATCRAPTDSELNLLVRLYEEQLAEYRKRPEDVSRVLAAGERPFDSSLDPSQLAAWTILAGVILNLDETVTQH